MTLADRQTHLFFVIAGERRFSDEHLKDEYAEAPPVYCPRVRRVRQNLRRQKLYRNKYVSSLPTGDWATRTGENNSPGVPQNVEVRQLWPMPSLQRPKSAILRKPSESRSKLSSFKSL